MVRAGELGTGGRESTTGDEGVGQSGPGSRSSEHLAPHSQSAAIEAENAQKMYLGSVGEERHERSSWVMVGQKLAEWHEPSGDPDPSLAPSRDRAAAAPCKHQISGESELASACVAQKGTEISRPRGASLLEANVPTVLSHPSPSLFFPGSDTGIVPRWMTSSMSSRTSPRR